MSELGKEEILATLSLLKKRCPYVTFTWEGHTINVAQAYAQLKAIVEQHFLDPGVKTEILAQEYEKGLKDGYEHAKKEQPDIDTEGVEEKISKWIDENIRMNELTIVEDHIYADEAQKEIDILRRIKQLLQQKPRKRVSREEIKRIYVDVRNLLPHQALDTLTYELKELGLEVEE